MRLVVAFCLASGACMVFGWPSHWWLLGGSFLAGAAGRGRRGSRSPASLTARVGAYTGNGGTAPPCEGCLPPAEARMRDMLNRGHLTDDSHADA